MDAGLTKSDVFGCGCSGRCEVLSLLIFGLRPSGIEQNEIGGTLLKQLIQIALPTGLSHMH